MKGHGYRLDLLSETTDTKVNKYHVSFAASFELWIRLYGDLSPAVFIEPSRTRNRRQNTPIVAWNDVGRPMEIFSFIFFSSIMMCIFLPACAHWRTQEESCFSYYNRHLWLRRFEEEFGRRTSFLWYRAFRVSEIAFMDRFPSRRYHRRAALVFHSAWMISCNSV